MIILSLISKANKKIAPKLLSSSLNARILPVLGPFIDVVCLPFFQRVISIEAEDDALNFKLEETRKKTFQSKNEGKAFGKSKRIFPWMDSTLEVSRQRLGKGKTSKHESSSLKSKQHLIQYNSLLKYLRPALLPTETFKDLKRWRENYVFVYWLKKELLSAKYKHQLRKVVADYPDLDLRHRCLKPPSRNFVRKAFGTSTWSQTHNGFAHETEQLRNLCESLGGKIVTLNDGITIAAEMNDENCSLADTSLEDVVELAGSFISSRRLFNVYCEEANIYDFWTTDYTSALANYLLDRSLEYSEGKTTIIEVGAGDGLLSKFLNDQISILQKRRINSRKIKSQNTRNWRARDKNESNYSTGLPKIMPEVITTDDGSWKIEKKSAIENLNVYDALEKYCNGGRENNQIIILCAWMPQGVDWTEAMRKSGVDEYILIGESDDGSCGDKWKTWGYSNNVSQDNSKVAPYELDGYFRTDLKTIAKLQLSRYDSRLSRSSDTISFRKRQ